MKLPHTIAASLLILALSSHAICEERWAILVGIDDYTSSQITPLKGAVRDVQAFQDALVKYAQFPSEKVFCLTSSGETDAPSLGNIITKLEYVASEARPDDVFLFFFSGHGVSRDAGAFLLTQNTQIQSPWLLERTSLPVGELVGRLKQIRAAKVVLILDACRNNPEAGKGNVDNPLTDDFVRGLEDVEIPAGPEGARFLATVYACARGQRAYEWPGKRRGFFSVAFEEALKGYADRSGNGQVTLNEIESYLDDRVPELLMRELGGSRSQTPWVDRRGSGAGDWIFSWKSTAIPPAAAQPALEPIPADDLFEQAPVEDLAPILTTGVPPTVEIDTSPSRPLNQLEARAGVRFEYRADDDRGILAYRYRLDNQESQETRRRYVVLSDLKAGKHTFQVQAKDPEGNWSYPAKAEFTILANLRPAASILSPASEGRVVDLHVGVLLSGSDTDGRVARYRCAIDLPDQFVEQDDARFVFEELADGPHTVFAQAVDDKGAGSRWVSSRFEYEYPEPRITDVLPGGATMEFVFIPSGTFTMGSPSSESGRSENEGPQHEVALSKGFYLGKYEVTQAQWQAVMGTTPWFGKDNVQIGSGYPATYVSWNDVQTFLEKLNDAAGNATFRLPTEAEWEYACRAGTTTRWSFGDDAGRLKDYAVYQENYLDEANKHPHKVGCKLPNPWGLFDMHGNVWEWCSDWYDEGDYAKSPSRDLIGPRSGTLRMVRGGAWTLYNASQCLRCAFRCPYNPTVRSNDVGFRCARGE